MIARKTGDWWQDERRNWCAYCGVAIKVDATKQALKPTRDHVIPRAHFGRHVTIPACRECNQKKGKSGLPEFLLTEYFSAARQKRLPNQWPLRDLWLVMALAAVEQARSHADAWPDGGADPDQAAKQQRKQAAKASKDPTGN